MTRPNILFITAHDLGKHISCYGNASVDSKNLDDLAAHGIRFENSFCTGPTCSPSRAALHTGRYAHSNGMMGLAHTGQQRLLSIFPCSSYWQGKRSSHDLHATLG